MKVYTVDTGWSADEKKLFALNRIFDASYSLALILLLRYFIGRALSSLTRGLRLGRESSGPRSRFSALALGHGCSSWLQPELSGGARRLHLRRGAGRRAGWAFPAPRERQSARETRGRSQLPGFDRVWPNSRRRVETLELLAAGPLEDEAPRPAAGRQFRLESVSAERVFQTAKGNGSPQMALSEKVCPQLLLLPDVGVCSAP